MFKLCTEYERNRTTRGGVIDDSARCRRPISKGAVLSGLVFTGARVHRTVPNFVKAYIKSNQIYYTTKG